MAAIQEERRAILKFNLTFRTKTHSMDVFRWKWIPEQSPCQPQSNRIGWWLFGLPRYNNAAGDLMRPYHYEGRYSLQIDTGAELHEGSRRLHPLLWLGQEEVKRKRK